MEKLKKTGFTFIELLIVTTIIVVFSSIAIPLFKSSYERLSLKISADKMIRLVGAAHELSILDRHTYKIFISESPAFFVLLRNSDQDHKIFEKLSGGLGKEQHLGYHEMIEFSEKEIFFFPNGSATESNLILKNKANDSISLKISNSGKVSKNVISK